ncbi:hypothetical protein AAHC03_025560 [Spirometra sp. Aus1]
MYGTLATKQPKSVSYSSTQLPFFVPFEFGSKHTKKVRVAILVAGVCSLLFVCSLICSVLFLASGVTSFTLISSVGPSIERAIDEQVITAYGFDGEVTNVIDNLQLEHACCGGSNYEVYEESRWASHPSDIVPKLGLVPDSCCVRNASTLEILDPKACHGDTLTLPNSVNSNGCASFLAVDDRYNLLVFASCSIALCVWMTTVACCAFYVYKVYPLTTVV